MSPENSRNHGRMDTTSEAMKTAPTSALVAPKPGPHHLALTDKTGATEMTCTDSTPRRIQRKRTKGWRMPPNAIYVGRPTRYGNPNIVGDLFNGGNMSAADAVSQFRSQLIGHRLQFGLNEIHRVLAGHDLACWCPLDQPCHADVLLELANGGVA